MAAESVRMVPAYAELHCLSNYTFLRGASYPDELLERAHALGYAALALTDECSLSGIVRAHEKAKALGLAFDRWRSAGVVRRSRSQSRKAVCC